MTISWLLAVSSAVPDTTYGNQDQIKVKFSEDTSMGGPHRRIGDLLSKQQVDEMFNFPCPIGFYYVGTWESRQIFTITIWDATDACLPILGEFFITVNATGNIRNYPPQSAPNEAISPTLTGDFGPSPLQILSVTGESSPIVDDVYGAFDTITLQLSHDSDQAGMTIGEIISQSLLLTLFEFEVNLGVFFYGSWTGPREIKIYIEDAEGATPPSLPCDVGALVCVGEANTVIGSFLASGNLRSIPRITAPVEARAPKLGGSFGTSTLKILSIVAQNGYRNDTPSVYGASDIINITFSRPTNRGFLPDVVSRAMILNMFTFSMPIGFDFYGEWASRSNLAIFIVDDAGAGPPTIGGLTLQVRESGNLMEHPPVTSRSTPMSPTLLGNFGPSPIEIVSFIATDSENDDSIFNAEDFITIQFSENTDKGLPANDPKVSQLEVDSMFEFSQSLGTAYEGVWLNFRTIRITITDAAGALPPVIDQLTVRVRPCKQYQPFFRTCIEDWEYCSYCDCCAGDLRNYPRTAAPAATISPPLRGDFGPCAMFILNITAFDALNYDSSLDDGDAIMVYFSEPVDKGCGRFYNASTCQDGKYLDKAAVDSLLKFSHVLAANYSAVWLSSTKLQINLIDVTGSEAQLGLLSIRILDNAQGEGNLPGIRNVPPVCSPREIESDPLRGNWGLAPPFVQNFQAVRGNGTYDSVYGNGDEILIHFCAGGRGSRGEGGCAPTNRFNFKEGEQLGKSMILRMFNFSQSLGQDFVGRWDDAHVFRITVLNASGATPPEVHKLELSVLHEGNCTCDDALCTFYTCSPDGLFLRDASNRSLFSRAKSKPIRGDWGPSSLHITNLQATPAPGDVPSNGFAYSAGDTITVTFSHDTNYGRGPPGCFEEYELWPGQSYPAHHVVPCRDNNQILSKSDLDGLFFFSQSLGADYEGEFTARHVLVITVKSAVSAFPPGVGAMYIKVLREGNLRAYPAAEEPSIAESPRLVGAFGPSSLKIIKIQAFDPGQDDMIYNAGDKISITFNQPTNRAYQDQNHVTKAEIDAVFNFSHSLGADYIGTWPSLDTFVIEILNTSGAAPRAHHSRLGAPYSAVDNSRYVLPQADADGIQVQWTETCNAAFCDPNGNTKFENFETLDEALPLYRLLVRGQADPSIFDTVDLPCTYDRIPRGIIRDIVILHNGLDLQADFWMFIKFTGRLRDVSNTEVFANFSTLREDAMVEYAARDGISLYTHGNITVPLVGDFGPSFLSVTSLTISDPDNQDVEYSNQDEIRVRFSDFTNMAFMKAGKVVSKDQVNSLVWCENADIEPMGVSAWAECGRLRVSGAGNAIDGIYAIQTQRSDGRPYYKQMYGGHYYIYSYCNKHNNGTGCARWQVGSSIGSVAAVYFADSGKQTDPSTVPAGTWQRWNGISWGLSSLMVTCGPPTGIIHPDTNFDALLEKETFADSCDVLGADYTGVWRDRWTFVITVTNSSGRVGYFDVALGQACSPLPSCAIVSVNAPAPGRFYLRIKPSAWLRNFPVSSGAVGHTFGGGRGSTPRLTGNYGVYVPQILKVVASDPDGADHVYGDGDRISIHFFSPTNLGEVAPCDAGALLSDDVEPSKRFCCSCCSSNIENICMHTYVHVQCVGVYP